MVYVTVRSAILGVCTHLRGAHLSDSGCHSIHIRTAKLWHGSVDNLATASSAGTLLGGTDPSQVANL